MTTIKKNILKIYALVLAAGILYYAFIKLTGLSIPCFIYRYTGMRCPACGITRMFFALAKFDIPLSFSCNPVMFILLIAWNIVAFLCFFTKIRLVKSRFFLYTLLYTSLASLFIFFLVRNFI
ncbi:MAG: DUF2752 domain-containing protein [Clostridia bacterium]|nr:DUF2752 domain-containing protein [Clostridia bacterium]